MSSLAYLASYLTSDITEVFIRMDTNMPLYKVIEAIFKTIKKYQAG